MWNRVKGDGMGEYSIRNGRGVSHRRVFFFFICCCCFIANLEKKISGSSTFRNRAFTGFYFFFSFFFFLFLLRRCFSSNSKMLFFFVCILSLYLYTFAGPNTNIEFMLLLMMIEGMAQHTIHQSKWHVIMICNFVRHSICLMIVTIAI